MESIGRMEAVYLKEKVRYTGLNFFPRTVWKSIVTKTAPATLFIGNRGMKDKGKHGDCSSVLL